MASQALAPTRARGAVPGLGGALAPLAIGLVALGLLFHEEIAAAIRVWIGSTAYNHCFLVIPIVAYLIWDRRDTLGGIAARPVPALALAALPLSVAWLVAERLGFMEGRQLIAMTCVETLFLAVLGRRAYWMLCGPLLYLYFLVPVGGFLVPPLQGFTAWFTMHGLDALGIVNFTDGYTIQIPEGTFFIAEACAGLRFLVASVAFGCLYALLIYRSFWRRVAFIGASLVVPVIANGFRALGIVTLGHVLGSAQAAETDHILYGWIFFSIVIFILIAIGLPFREDQFVQPTAPVSRPSPGRRPLIVASVATVLALAALGPLAAFALTRSAGAPATAFDLPGSGGCQRLPVTATAAKAAPAIVANRYACGGTDRLGLSVGGVMLRAETFAPRAGPRDILDAETRLTRTAGVEDTTSRVMKVQGLPWTMMESESPAHLAAALLWQDGKPLAPDIRFRVRQAWSSIVGGGAPTVLVVLTPDPDLPDLGPEARREARRSIETFLRSTTGMRAALDAAAPAR